MENISLFEIKNNNVEVYTLYPKIAELRLFRKSILEHRKLFYCLKTSHDYPRNICAKLNEGVYRLSKRRLRDMDGYANMSTYNSIYGYTPATIKRNQEVILDSYINGDLASLNYKYLPQTAYHYYDDKTDGERQLYLLVTNQEIITDSVCNMKNSKIDNILSLPEAHFQLHMLLNGYYEEICNDKIKLDPTLFYIEYCRKISIDKLMMLYSTGLLNENIDEIYEKVANTTKILRQLKR
jgi:hypothetical protein